MTWSRNIRTNASSARSTSFETRRLCLWSRYHVATHSVTQLAALVHFIVFVICHRERLTDRKRLQFFMLIKAHSAQLLQHVSRRMWRAPCLWANKYKAALPASVVPSTVVCTVLLAALPINFQQSWGISSLSAFPRAFGAIFFVLSFLLSFRFFTSSFFLVFFCELSPYSSLRVRGALSAFSGQSQSRRRFWDIWAWRKTFHLLYSWRLWYLT